MSEGHRTKSLNKPCVLIIVIGGMERFVFKGVASNLVIYLTDVMKMSNSSAVRSVNNWCGFTYIVPLLVATLADSYWDRYSTILASSFVYLVGLLAFTSTTLNRENSSSSSSSMYWPLYLISLGLGGYNPALQAFGADQIDDDDEVELPTTKNDKKTSKKSLFFQWWYFGVCIGSLLGFLIVPNIQDSVGWGLGFAIPPMAMAVSIVLFSCGSRFYLFRHDKEVKVNTFDKIVQAIKCSVSRIARLKTNEKSSLVELELEQKPLCSNHRPNQTDDDDNGGSTITVNKDTSPFGMARVVLRLLPIWTTLLMFAVIFQQPATFFIKQGTAMDRRVAPWSPSYLLPPATLQSAITVSIILLMPFYESHFVPFTRRLLRNDRGITTIQRIATGMLLSVAAMTFAATLESRRLANVRADDDRGTLSILWLLPQYVLLGVSDVFTVVGMQEFFYSEVPAGMRTMGIALYTSVFGVGSFLSALMVYLVEVFTEGEDGQGGWFSDDMREARLDKYYWLLAGASALSLVAFVGLCRWYKTSS